MKRFARKETIYLRGEEARTLYRLEEGLVRVVELLPDGRLITLRHVLPGDYFGDEALEGKAYRYTAEAMNCCASAGKTPDGRSVICVTANAWTGEFCIEDHIALDSKYCGSAEFE